VMGKKTIGEFVDGEMGLAKLREIGVDFAQGNWISPPSLFVAQAPVAKRATAESARVSKKRGTIPAPISDTAT
jgi:EAL domain-containing protein (putative c-di-GMP-specific phosphodiesterase class I)